MPSPADSSLRHHFPIFAHMERQGIPFHYLDTAATSQKPQGVIDAITRYYAEGCGTIHRALYPLAEETTDAYQSVRRQVAAFLNSKEEEVLFTSGTTGGINQIARSIAPLLPPKGEIIVSAMEHHANLIPWQELCRREGFSLKILPLDERGDLSLSALEEMLSPKTALVAVTHLSNVTGGVNPLPLLAERVHASGALLIVDGAQAASILPLNMQALGADAYAFSGHKMGGPTGIGVLYLQEKLLNRLPPSSFGGDMVSSVSPLSATYQEPPLRFEAGTPHIAGVIGLGAALSFLTEASQEFLFAHDQDLLRYTLDILGDQPGIRILGNPRQRAHLLTFTIEGVHPLDLGALLSTRGICARTGKLCAEPLISHFGISSALRFSFGPYTTRSDIEQGAAALAEASALLFS
ncbi:MAG: cysteine desulfurase [Chlamydiota bacterium]|nr:cysteine desulfurase [Chlamydiota bacterium]